MKQNLPLVLFIMLLALTRPSFAQPGAALSFDGSNDQVSIANAASLNISGNITLEGWVYATKNTGIQNVICKSSNSQNTGYIFPRTDDGWAHMVVYLHIGGGWKTLSAPYGAYNQWHHMAATWDGTYIRLYLDGALVATSGVITGAIAVNTNALTLGEQPGYVEYFGGLLDECRVWNVARTQCEINTYKDCEIPASAAGLVANYHFNQGVAGSSNAGVTLLTDASGNSNDGTLNNFALSGASSNWIAPGGVTSGSITPLPPPAVGFTATNPVVCNSGTAALTGTGANTYTWSGGITDGMPFAISSTTSYTVTGTNSVTTCGNSAVATISVGTTPTLSVNSGSVCAGQSFTINPSGAVSYTIQGGSNVVTPSGSTTYTVIGADALGCVSAADSSMVTVNPNPSVSVNSGSICAGQSFTINPSGAVSYTIQGGANVVMPMGSATYTVMGADSAGCTALATSSVVVNPNPTVNASASNTFICSGSSTTLTATGASTYMWNPGSMIGSSIGVSPTGTTTYSVTGTDSFGCMGMAAVQVSVSLCTGIDEHSQANAIDIYPNPGSGEFMIQSPVNMSLTIIDPTGKVVAVAEAEAGAITKLSLVHLPTGLYSVVGRPDSGQLYSKRLVIMR